VRYGVANGAGGQHQRAADGHVGLELDCVDRLYLNAYVTLQVSG